ncbi:MAG: TonB-dependent receptor [Cellulophaga sp.]
MKKSNYYNSFLQDNYCKKMKLKMKLSFILTFLMLCQLSAHHVFSQHEIEFTYNQVSLKQILSEIKSQSGYNFFYNTKEINDTKKLSLSAKKESLKQVLNKLSIKANFNFKISGKQIVLTKKALSIGNTSNEKQEKDVRGMVKDETGAPLPGANVLVKGTTTGTQTDFDGNFTIEVPNDDAILVFSYVGYTTVEVSVSGKTFIEVALTENAAQLDDVILVGTRNPNRTATDTAVPVDVIDVAALASKGPQTSITEILNYVAPSFTSQAQTVSDGTDHIDPASLRGLGPDQVLVLINGKRRHKSSLLNINGTVGAGSVGTDLNSIPTAAIKRIEVLRDGAAAQYGSDAIAGVINIVLKNATNKLDLSVTMGANMSSKSNHQDGGMDGEKIQVDANYGLDLGENGGYINFTGSVGTRAPALRNATNLEQIFDIANAAEHAYTAANPGSSIANMRAEDYQTGAGLLGTNYISAANQASIAGLDLSRDADGNLNTPTDLEALRGFLPEQGTGEFGTYQELDDAQFAARGLERNDFRFKVGTAKLREGKFFSNLSIPVTENTDIYSFAGIAYRQGLAFGFLREPWRTKGNTSVYPNGFLPGIQSDIVDKSFAVGIKGKTEGGWNVDFSNSFGSNAFGFTIVNTSNASLGAASPTTFDAGSFKFSQNTTNLDVSKFHEGIFAGLNVAMGAEYRVDNFEILAGKEDSYTTYDNNRIPTVGGVGGATNALGESLPGTSQVFGGFTPQNATNKFRNSIGMYADFEADITEKFLVSLATRFESFSDFGETFNYKLASRLKLTDEFSLRGAINTGFRAPSLHQQFFSRSSTQFNADGVAEEVGLFTNDSQAAKLIGIGKLKEETSQSVSIGVTGKVGGFTVTVDAYQITIDDRIVLSGKFSAGDNIPLQNIFKAVGAGKAQFLANAIDTKNQGLDLVLGHKATIMDNFTLDNSLSATFSKTEVTSIKVPKLIADAGLSGDFFDGQEEAFLTIAQPRTKLNLTHSLSNDKWTFLLRNVFFGEVTDPDDYSGVARVSSRDANEDAVYASKIITDFTVSNNITKNTTITIGANNLLDVYPDDNREKSQSNASFPYSRRTSQFGFTGRYVFARLSFTIN